VWTFTVNELNGVPIAELVNAYDRRVERPLSRTDSCSFRIRDDHPQAETLLDGDCLVVAYDGIDPVPKFVGEPIGAEEQAAEQQGTIRINCGGALFRLGDRLIGKSLQGIKYGSASSQLDRTEIATQILDATMNNGDTGIREGAVLASSLSYAGPWWYKPAAEAILEIATAFDGFEFEFTPREPTPDASGVALWTFNAQAAFGQNRPDAIFEFGTGKHNVKGYQRIVDRSRLLNRGYHLPPGFPDNAADQVVSVAENAASIAARGLHEGVVESDVVSQPLRQRLVEEHVLVRKRPRQMITFQPTLNVGYRFGTDFGLGDVVVFRAVRSGRIKINAAFRILRVAWNIDDNGNEQIELGITPEDEA
jgi:hypothetical protein